MSADALSRLPNPSDGDYNEPVIDKELVLNLMVFGDLKTSKTQRSDLYLSWVIDILEGKIEYPVSKKKLDATEKRLFGILPNLVLEKGRLWYLLHVEGSRDRLLFVVPECDVVKTISEVHDSETGGHLGIDKTLDKIKARFYWVGMAKDVKRYVTECHFCQATKAPKSYPVAPLQPILPSKPMNLVTMDLIGPLKETARGNQYILNIIDHLSKYGKSYPLRNKETESVANKVVKYALTFGIPDAALSDQGTEFQNAVLKSVWELLDVHQLKTSPYQPQADGITERYNRTLEEMLTHFVDEEQSDWDLKLDKVVFAYNTSVHAVTKKTPFELMFGRQAKIPLDLVYGLGPETSELVQQYEVDWDYTSYSEQLKADLSVRSRTSKQRQIET